MRRRARPLLAGATLAVVVAATSSACGVDDGGTAADGATCAPVEVEELDPGTRLHPLQGAPEPEYLTDPPTSGPYLGGMPPTGVRDEPLPRPAQVAHLHHGMVVLQHRDLEPAEREAIEELGGGDVVVAPDPDLPDRVVATAWRTKLRCDGVDVAALERFVADHVGGGPAGHPG